MANPKPWSTTMSGSAPVQDPDPITGSMPNLDDSTTPEAEDGDLAFSDTVESLRDKSQVTSQFVGDSAKNPSGSIRNVLDMSNTDPAAAGSAQFLRLTPRGSAPAGSSASQFLLVMDDSGDKEFYFVDGANNIVQITKDGNLNLAGSGGTLDDSYDYGGAGLGRHIIADSYPVWISSSNGYYGLYIDTDDADDLTAGLYIYHLSKGRPLVIDSMDNTRALTSDGLLEILHSTHSTDEYGMFIHTVHNGESECGCINLLEESAGALSSPNQSCMLKAYYDAHTIDDASGTVRGIFDTYFDRSATNPASHYGWRHSVGTYVLPQDRLITSSGAPIALSGKYAGYLIAPATSGYEVVTSSGINGAVIAIDDSGDIELAWKDDEGNVVQLTRDGAPIGASPLTTKGDLYTYDTGDQRLAVGANDTLLYADSSEPTGLKWKSQAFSDDFLVTAGASEVSVALAAKAQGIESDLYTLSADRTITSSGALAPIPTEPVKVTGFYIRKNESVVVSFAAMRDYISSASTTYSRMYAHKEPAGTPTGIGPNVTLKVDSTFTRFIGGDTFLYTAAEEGYYTFELYAGHAGTDFTMKATSTEIRVWRHIGGYSRPENFPILEYVDANTVQLAAGPGAASDLSVCLNDGIRRTVQAPLEIDLTVSGEGGLDTGSEAISTWYYAYLVEDSSDPTALNCVCSVTDPDGGGPTGYPKWKFIEAFLNDASGDIQEFDHIAGQLQLRNTIIIANRTGIDGSPVALDCSSALPKTAGIALLRAGGSNFGTGYVTTSFWPITGDTSKNSRISIVFDECNNNELIELACDTTQQIYTQNTSSGGGTFGSQEICGIGWISRYNQAQQQQYQATSVLDTKPVMGAWTSATTVNFDARPGQPSITYQTLQDGKQRYMTTGAWDIANGVADWGYDEAASQGNTKFLYFYEVPKSGDDNQIVIRASDNPPSTGPTGYTNFKYVWATYIDGSGNLLKVHQRRNRFFWDVSRTIFSLSNTAAFAYTAYDLALPATGSTGPYCPITAGEVMGRTMAWHTTTAHDRWDIRISYNSTDPLSITGVADVNLEAGGQMVNFDLPVDPVNNSRIYIGLIHVTGSSPNLNYAHAAINGWNDEWIDP